jgi:hypothetical protein
MCIGPAWGPFHSDVDTTSQTLFTSDRKFWLHFSHFADVGRHGLIGEREGNGKTMVYPCAGDMGPAWGPFLSHGDTTSRTLFTLDHKFRPHFSHFTDFGRHGLIEEGEGNGEPMVSPRAEDMGPAWGPFLSREDTTSQTLFTSDRKFRLHFSHFTGFGRHGLVEEREGNGESMVSPSTGDMGPAWGPFLSHGDTTSRTLFTPDHKFRPHFCHFTDFGLHGLIGEGKGNGESMVSPCAWDLLGDPFTPTWTPPVKHYSLLTANSGFIFLTLPTLGAMA